MAVDVVNAIVENISHPVCGAAIRVQISPGPVTKNAICWFSVFVMIKQYHKFWPYENRFHMAEIDESLLSTWEDYNIDEIFKDL